MAGTMSGQINIQGLGIGTDFSEIVDKLKVYESIPKMRMQIWREEWNLRTTGFQDIMATMSEARTALKSLNNMNQMFSKIVDSSQSSVATATANAKIDEGVYSIDVMQLAKAATFSNKHVFAGKDEKVNTSGADQTFSYSYQGTTRTVSVANNCTLEQLVTKINNDGQNPGVSATLIKSGSGYVFQLQGRDTGSASSLSVESTLAQFDGAPHYSGRDVILNNTGASQDFTYSHKGQTHTFTLTDGMTAAQFISAFNQDPGNIGVTASLVQKGSDYVIQYKDAATRANISLNGISENEYLGSLKPMNAGDVVNSTGANKAFRYTYEGAEYTVNVPAGATAQEFVDLFNASTSAQGRNIQARLNGGNLEFVNQDAVLESTPTGDPMVFEYTAKDGSPRRLGISDGTTLNEFVKTLNLSVRSSGWTAEAQDDPLNPGTKKIVILDENGIDITASQVVSGAGATNISLGGWLPGDMPLPTSYSSEMAALGGRKDISGKDLLINNTGAPAAYSFTYNGQTRTFDVADQTSMSDFVDQFNSEAAGTGVKAVIAATGSGYAINFADETTNAAVQLDNVTTSLNAVRGAADNYYTQQASDARFTMNGWPMEFTSETNTLTEVVDGLEITLKSAGQTTLAVSNDKESLKENITAAVDAINTMLAKIRELSKYDEDKEVKTPEVEDSTGLLKMVSQFTWQKGAVLQGNYGVQLLQSRLKNILTDKADGFIGKQSATDALNDSFTTLSKIGINTVSNESETDFGLLRIDEQALDQAIDEDIKGVAQLLALELSGSTTSSDFWVASTGTRAVSGVYDVKYDVDPNTKQAVNVYINGAKAQSDPAYPGRWTVADYSNAAAGLAIQFGEADLAVTGTTRQAQVQVKEGKLPEMIRQLEAELQPVVEGSTEKAGALPLLIDNYQEIVKNIDKKITRETERLTLWEKRQKAKYARLDTLLATYSQQMESNSAQLAQLSKKSSS